MNLLRLTLLCVLWVLTGCASTAPFTAPNATGSYLSSPEQCVPYARRVSGIEIYGDAATWWPRAAGKYERGQQPRLGAVLVLRATKKMREGHVAVVKRIISPRQIYVTHSNWGNDRHSRRVLYHAMLVEDLSRANDWTNVRFWNQEMNVFGFPYAAYGFIYK